MEMPKYHEAFIPVLKILSSKKTMVSRVLAETVRDQFFAHLPHDLLKQKTRTGANVLLDRILWAKSYLKMGKFVRYPKRGSVEITEKGLKQVQIGKLSLEDLKADHDFLEYKQGVEQEKEDGIILDSVTLDGATPQDLIDSGFNSIESEVKSDLLERLKQIDPFYFERVILILLKKMGYGEFMETSKTGDGGVDGVINQDKLGLEKIYTQAKRYNEGKVREKDIRNFIGAMSGDTNKGVFITTSRFDEQAVKKAREAHHKIILIDGAKLVDLMHEHNVGVQVKDSYEVKEIDNDFFEEA